MGTDWEPPRTSTALRRFNVWFGAIFLTIGLVALGIAGTLFVSLRASLGMGNEIWAFLGAPLGVGTVFSILGGTFMTIGLRRSSRERHLLESGTTGEATITSIGRTGTRVNRRHLWCIRYTYTDLVGVSHTGDSGYLSAEDARSYDVGQQVFVRYDPGRPADSVWLGRHEAPDRT